jgi:phospholipase/carboxylesterase
MQLDGPRLEPRGAAPSSLIVLLHGYGANGEDLIALADGWRRQLPEAVFVAPNAPQSISRDVRRIAMVCAHHA